MNAKNLDGIFKPRSIALVGASETQGKLGNILLRNPIEGGSGGLGFKIDWRNEEGIARAYMHFD